MDEVFALADINAVAERFLKAIDNHKVIALHGEMGAGKTTFVRAVCDALGVKDVVSSPTFSIINEYRGGDGEIIYHIDLYRLKNEQDAASAGVEECLYSGRICFVEWPEITPRIFPENTLHCRLSLAGNNTRRLQIKL